MAVSDTAMEGGIPLNIKGEEERGEEERRREGKRRENEENEEGRMMDGDDVRCGENFSLF